MDGTELLNEIARRIKDKKGLSSLSDAALSKELGITQPALGNYRNNKLTARKICNLFEKISNKIERDITNRAVMPIVEFFPLDPIETTHGSNLHIFPTTDDKGAPHPYLVGLRNRLQQTHGIYIFHDSRGQAIYAGKAREQSLWDEMNKAFNRDRGEVQNIKRVHHPSNRIQYKGPEEKKRQIVKESVTIYHIASYMSAYQVLDDLIGKLEALIVRSFANDLLNVRMENF